MRIFLLILPLARNIPQQTTASFVWTGWIVVDAASKSLSINVNEGLYVLRYLAGAEPRSAPSAFVKLPIDDAGYIDIIMAPGFDDGAMPGPGSNLVLVVRRAGLVEVVIQADSRSSGEDARFSLDLLAPAMTRDRQATMQTAKPRARVGAEVKGQRALLELSAHVARRGDILADAEGWIAGPNSPSAIEGLEVRCNRADVGVSMQYKNQSSARRWSSWQSPGTFVGTRQKASPITGLRLKIVGAASVDFELEGEALFLGSTIMAARGNELEFESAGGSDPLVGFRLDFVEVFSAKNDPPERKPPRVRVFRSYVD